MTELTPTADRGLREVVGRLGYDVLGGWDARVWHLQDDASYRGGQRRATPEDVARHLLHEHTIAVAPITRSIVIDADIGKKGERATDEQKEEAAAAVSLILDTFGIPHLTFDSLRGTHTWIRLDRDPAPAELGALRALLDGAATGASFDIFPRGNTAIRLPFGFYEGTVRRPLTGESDADVLRWLMSPERATDEQLLALTEGATASQRPPELSAAPAPRVKPPARRSEGRQTQPPESTAPHQVTPPAPLTGWERWPSCKRQVAVEGPLAGTRHNTLLALANEAVESGERDHDRLTRFLLAVPRPHSDTGDAEHRADAIAAVTAALKLHAANDFRRFSSCPHIPHHTGHPVGQTLRATFEHECLPERAQACPIHQAWARAANLPAFAHIVASSIWRDGSGQHGRGLGLKAKEVYKFLVRRSGGDPEFVVDASQRYIAFNLPNVARRNAVRAILHKLIEYGLIERAAGSDADWPKWRVPFRPPAWVAELEARLGTDELETRERTEILKHWRANEHLRTL